MKGKSDSLFGSEDQGGIASLAGGAEPRTAEWTTPTVAPFVRRHRAALNSLFVQVLSLCGRRGLVDPSAVAVDGSPMEANASRDANQRLGRLEETMKIEVS